jgi:type I restriction enzyme M protein
LTENHSATIVKRIWSYCDVLRDDGVSYNDYLEQLTYLLFLKMADERGIGNGAIPAEFSWPTLVALDGAELDNHYREILLNLGQGPGLIPTIYRKAQNRIQDPAKLRRLVKMIDEHNWSAMTVDVKAEIYEGLLEKNAQDVKSGAGQYFTPRPLIEAMVDVMQPRPGQLICDPAAGTGGFLIAAHDYVRRHHRHSLDREKLDHLNNDALHGWEIVDNTARLCVMNLWLHGIGHGRPTSPIHVDDSLAGKPGMHFDMVLTNPPFGKKSSVTYVTDTGEIKREAQTVVREDFWTSGTNKQLNFLQHVYSILKTDGGTAAIVVPDNVLFEGGQGETVRRQLLKNCDVHTLLRLPTGIFYAQGVKANVLFFDKRPGRAEPWTNKLWIYDLRTNQHFTLVQNPLARADLDEFVTLYNPDNRHQRTETWSEDNPDGRWRAYTYEQLQARDKLNLDIFWLRDDSLTDTTSLPDPAIIAAGMVADLESALEQLRLIAADLEEPEAAGSLTGLASEVEEA